MRHIAILRQPFFDMVLNGEKTIESRWALHKVAPFNKIKQGDLILLKETGKPVNATAIAGRVEFFELTPKIAEDIKSKWGKEIGTDKFANWEEILTKKYCTLIWLKDVKRIAPLKVKRSSGAGWIVLDDVEN